MSGSLPVPIGLEHLAAPLLMRVLIAASALYAGGYTTTLRAIDKAP